MSVIAFYNVSKKFAKHAGQMLRSHLTRFLTGQKDDPFFATRLGLVAGISRPDEGTVAVNGQVAALPELGSGFHPDLTGRQQTAVAFERMLAFSVAIHRDLEAMLVDEGLAVGDAAFQAKNIDRIHEFRNAGEALLCVSHPTMIRQLCDRAIWRDYGESILSGAAGDVLEAYAGRQTAPA